MVTLAVILGPVGAVLLLVSLVGGGFSFSGWAMPKIGRVARIPCFVIGAVLVVLSIPLAVADSSMNPSEQTAVGWDTTVPAPAPVTESETVVYVGEVYTMTDAYAEPYLDADVTSHLYEGDLVDIYCTVQGEVVYNEEIDYTSSL
jgi:type IV secretory pathway protease TraF